MRLCLKSLANCSSSSKSTFSSAGRSSLGTIICGSGMVGGLGKEFVTADEGAGQGAFVVTEGPSGLVGGREKVTGVRCLRDILRGGDADELRFTGDMASDDFFRCSLVLFIFDMRVSWKGGDGLGLDLGVS